MFSQANAMILASFIMLSVNFIYEVMHKNSVVWYRLQIFTLFRLHHSEYEDAY